MTTTRRTAPWMAAIAAGMIFAAAAQAASIEARAAVRATQFDGYVTAAYDGEPGGFAPLTVVTSDPADPVRYAEAGAALGGLYVGTRAGGSGTRRPDGVANLSGYEIRIADTPALHAAIAANAGEALSLIARFDVAFAMVNTPNPKFGPLQGPFNQTVTKADVTIDVRGLAPARVSGAVQGSNGPFDAYSLVADGVASVDRINQGYFAVDVPFRIDAAHLAAGFDVEATSFSLSLDLPTSSSVSVLTPTAADIFLASGASLADLGLHVQTSAVPLPAAVWTFAAALLGSGLYVRRVRARPSSV